MILVESLGIVPRLDKTISDSESSSLVGAEIVEVETSSSKGVLDVVDDLPLDRGLVALHVSGHQLPHFFFGAFLVGFTIVELGSVKIRIRGLQFELRACLLLL